jgi:hypothetical protein
MIDCSSIREMYLLSLVRPPIAPYTETKIDNLIDIDNWPRISGGTVIMILKSVDHRH